MLKFRAYDRIAKKVLDVVAIDFESEEITVIDHGTQDVYGITKGNGELLQFVGATDYNGDELHVGSEVVNEKGETGYVAFLPQTMSYRMVLEDTDVPLLQYIANNPMFVVTGTRVDA